MKKNITELHLMIIWEKARYKEKEIISHLGNRHKILDIYNITWPEKDFSQNLSRFYGENLPPNSFKEVHCGTGEFKLILFTDENPIYECVYTSRGSEYVNKNIFDLKALYRDWTGGGHKIHTTNSPEETQHDILLLLHKNYEDYYQEKESHLYPSEHISRMNLLGGGHQGWMSLQHMLDSMNNNLIYVVLRNFDVFPNDYYSSEHGDIDFLVEDLDKAVFLLGAKKVFKEEYRVHYEVIINGETVYLDLRYVGDDYYTELWERKILSSRHFDSKGFYRPSDENYYFSLAYHAFFHKSQIADDYVEKLRRIGKVIYSKNITLSEHYENLLEFLSSNQYLITKPIDDSVFFDVRFIPVKEFHSELDRLFIKDVHPFNISAWKNGSGFNHFLGIDSVNRRLFIKRSSDVESIRKEYEVIRYLKEKSNIKIPDAIYCRYIKGSSFIALDFLEGAVTFSNFFRSSKNKSECYSIMNQLYQIILNLNQVGIVHRDIKPDNLLVLNNVVYLIDFQFAIDKKRKTFKELKIVQKNKEIIQDLGEKYARGLYRWDDAYSAYKIFKEYTKSTDLSDDLLNVESDLKKMIGALEVFDVKNKRFAKQKWYFKSLKKSCPILLRLKILKIKKYISNKRKYEFKIEKLNLKLKKIWGEL